VGNLKLAEFITGQTSPSVYRATHYTDNAPKAPFNETSLDYTHSSPEYWINVPLKQEVTVDDVIYVEAINSKKGNAGHGSYSSTQLDQNHFFYFGPMQVCEYPADIDLSEAP
jgi:triacylglycerol lipase